MVTQASMGDSMVRMTLNNPASFKSAICSSIHWVLLLITSPLGMDRIYRIDRMIVWVVASSSCSLTIAKVGTGSRIFGQGAGYIRVGKSRKRVARPKRSVRSCPRARTPTVSVA